MRKSVERLREELNRSPEGIMITVQRKDLEKTVHQLERKVEEWSEQSCLGYVIQWL